MCQDSDANPLFYEHTDNSDHPAGGACLSVFRDEQPVDRLVRYSDEYFMALCAVYVASGGETSGWQYAAPAVFLAHHACELALKVKWLRADPEISVESAAFKKHDLSDIMKRIDKAEGWSDSEAAAPEQLGRLVRQVRAVTTDGISIRYATIDERWCCLNLGALVELVTDLRSIALRLPVEES